VQSKDGYARMVASYDERRHLTDGAFFDEHGEKLYRVALSYDDEGHTTRREVSGLDGKDGFASKRQILDEKGNVIEGAYFDKGGKPVLSKDGYARWTATYDEPGNQIKTTYLDAEGNPVPSKDGYERPKRGSRTKRKGATVSSWTGVRRHVMRNAEP